MAKTLRVLTGTITVADGTGSITLSAVKYRAIIDSGGYLEQVLVTVPNESVDFDFLITDTDGYVPFDLRGHKGKINDITRVPMKGTYTLSIANATINGTYTFKLMFREQW